MPQSASIAAAAALLVLSGCASAEPSLRPDVDSLRAEIRTLQRENADLTRRVEAMGTQLDVLAARSARGAQPAGGETKATPQAAATAASPPASSGASWLVPANLKVVRLEQPKPAPTRAQKAAAAGAKSSSPVVPAVPTATPIQEPSSSTLAALGTGGKAAGAGSSQAVLDAALALTGLSRARALEQFTDAHSRDPRAAEALVDAARTRAVAGDPDGSCEDFTRAVAEYPTARATSDALEGLATCEQRRGRPAEAQVLLARLAKDFPDSPAGKRARERAPTVQGASP